MNLIGFKWQGNYRQYEVTGEPFYEAYSSEYVYVVTATNIENGERTEYYLSEDYIVTRIQRQILDEIDNLNYFYTHQDHKNHGRATENLLELWGYLTDDSNA